MKRLIGLLLLLLALASPARAHFLFLLPSAPDARAAVRAVFSDGPRPDKPELLKKVAHAEFFARDAAGKVTPVKATQNGDVLDLELTGKGPHVLLGVCPYGVYEKGKSGPFLLNYYAKSFLLSSEEKLPENFYLNTFERFPLEIVPVLEEPGTVRVLWHGKPLPGAEVVVQEPGKEEGAELKTDDKGQVKLAGKLKPGLWAARALHSEEKKGEKDGKKYNSIRHIATLTAQVRGDKAPADSLASPEATRLLTDARAARANWEKFPGFTADLEVNVDGKVSKGAVDVSPEGKVSVKLEGDARDWARQTLASTVGHRLDNSAGLNTPCAFLDEVTDHPLGRAIKVLNDEFHSSYRIRDRQVIVVNRRAGPVRFTITVLENKVNAEKKFLPVSYVVNTWDVKTDALKSSASHHQTWERVGHFDLPHVLTVVTASGGAQEARTIRLTNWRLKE
jgi:uncharacterized GH25 family protein